MIRMMRNTTNFGTKVATSDQALDRPVEKLTDAVTTVLLQFTASHKPRGT